MRKPTTLIAGKFGSRHFGTKPYLADAVRLTGRDKPVALYIGAASGEDRNFGSALSALLKGAGIRKVVWPKLSKRKKKEASAARAALDDADLVFVGGGDVEAGIDALREADLVDDLRDAAKRGVVFVGMSAGAIMLGERWIRWPREGAGDDEAETYECLGLAPCSLDTHGEGDGWRETQSFAAVRARELGKQACAYGVPSGGALVIRPTARSGRAATPSRSSPRCRTRRRRSRRSWRRRVSYSAAHWRRVGDETRQMVAEVPLYRDRPAPPRDPATVYQWLAQIPTVGKRDLRKGFPKALLRRDQDLHAAMQDEQVTLLATSGTTADRLQVIWEWSWWDPQEREAMRLNARIERAMARAGFREAVLTTPACGAGTCHFGSQSVAERSIDGMLFFNESDDPTHWTDADYDRMLREWAEFGPRGVEADPAYLALIARAALKRGQKLARARVRHAHLRDDDARDAPRHWARARRAALPTLWRHRGRRAVHGVRARPSASERAA